MCTQMNIINEDMLHTILTSSHHPKMSSIRILGWHVDENMVKAGTNCSSQVSRLTIRYQQQDKTLPTEENFFLKVPSNAPLYDLGKKLGCYDTEVAMYTAVLPQMYTIEGDDDEEYFSPRQYYFDDKLSLVLEDLSQSGYRCADRIEQLDVEHSLYALRSLAKFHALSVKLEKTLGLPESVKHCPFMNPNEKPDENTLAFMSQSLIFLDNLPQDLKDRYPDAVAHFRNMSSPEAWTKMADDLSTTTFKVLNHGDFLINNIMFKYDKYGAVRNMNFIDFQLTLWSTPARDLIYFIVSSVKFEVYLKYFPLLMKIYLDTLNRVLLRLDCSPYKMCDLLRDIDIMYPFAVTVLCGILPGVISDPDDPIDSKELRNDDKIEMQGMAKTYKQKYFQDISAKWFKHLAVKGTL